MLSHRSSLIPAGLVPSNQPERENPGARASRAIDWPLTPQIDHKHGDRPVFETIAILEYLTALYDPEGRISYKLDKEPDLWTQQQSWLAWAQGGLGAHDSFWASANSEQGRCRGALRSCRLC